MPMPTSYRQVIMDWLTLTPFFLDRCWQFMLLSAQCACGRGAAARSFQVVASHHLGQAPGSLMKPLSVGEGVCPAGRFAPLFVLRAAFVSLATERRSNEFEELASTRRRSREGAS